MVRECAAPHHSAHCRRSIPVGAGAPRAQSEPNTQHTAPRAEPHTVGRGRCPHANWALNFDARQGHKWEWSAEGRGPQRWWDVEFNPEFLYFLPDKPHHPPYGAGFGDDVDRTIIEMFTCVLTSLARWGLPDIVEPVLGIIPEGQKPMQPRQASDR